MTFPLPFLLLLCADFDFVLVNYGKLFANTMGSMPALSGTLVCAKKRDVVEYEGGYLALGSPSLSSFLRFPSSHSSTSYRNVVVAGCS